MACCVTCDASRNIVLEKDPDGEFRCRDIWACLRRRKAILGLVTLADEDYDKYEGSARRYR